MAVVAGNNSSSVMISSISRMFAFWHSEKKATTVMMPSVPLTSFASCCVASKSAAVSSGGEVQAPATTASVSTRWSEFAKHVSGEWDGFGADFTAQGKPIELPESVVPEAYREWEVKVFDWQTQCPTLAQPHQLVMSYKTIKLLPTVGCEADAATRYSILERTVGTPDSALSAFSYHSGGSYVAVWPIAHHPQFELEHCFINPLDPESRIRIIQLLRFPNAEIVLQSIQVFCEQWYGPFRNGDQLGGCAIRDYAFASTAPTKASDVIGAWQGPRAVAKFGSSQNNFLQELVNESEHESLRDEDGLILLPKQTWCSFQRSKDGESCCEAGWLFDHGAAITSRCIFSGDAKLKEMSIARETTTILEVA